MAREAARGRGERTRKSEREGRGEGTRVVFWSGGEGWRERRGSLTAAKEKVEWHSGGGDSGARRW